MSLKLSCKVLEALKLASIENYKNLLFIESDSAIGVPLIPGDLMPTYRYAGLIRKIKLWLEKDWVIRVKHNFREANSVAN